MAAVQCLEVHPHARLLRAEQEDRGRSESVVGWNGQPFPDSIESIILPDGQVLGDAGIWPAFCQTELGLDPDELFTEILAIPTLPSTDEILFNPSGDSPHWITGAHPALRYRGNILKRDKIWLQSDYNRGLRRYGYTGWQWRISYATRAVETVPPIHRLTERLNAGLVRSGHLPHNHWILTRYEDQDDSIGYHSDKERDFASNSFFIVIKFGAPRPFAFRLRRKGKREGEPFFSRELSAGTAVFVRCRADGAANGRVEHGVPATSRQVGVSGSIVSRCIRTLIPWDRVHQKVSKRMTMLL